MPDGSIPTPTPLSRRRKAAVIYQFFTDCDVAPDLSTLPPDVQISLTREIATIGQIDRVTIDHVIAEFLDALEQVGMSGPDGLGDALEKMGASLSPSAAETLQEELTGTDPWAPVRRFSATQIRDIMTAESTEVASVLLAQLPVELAAEALGQLPGEQARKITYAMSRTNDIAPAILGRIGTSIAENYTSKTGDTKTPPPKRLGAILTATKSAVRDNLLHELGQEDADFTKEVRQAIFTFADIPARIAPPDVPTIIRENDGDTTITSLAFALAQAGPTTDAATYILCNLSKRMSEQMKEDIDSTTAVSPADGEAAQTRFVATISALAERGAITLIHAEAE